MPMLYANASTRSQTPGSAMMITDVLDSVKGLPFLIIKHAAQIHAMKSSPMKPVMVWKTGWRNDDCVPSSLVTFCWSENSVVITIKVAQITYASNNERINTFIFFYI